MADKIEFPDEVTEPRGIGSELRAAREKRGLTVEQVAAQTRISQRHIQAIESGDFASLPGRTYAIGFSRNIAKVVGLDQDKVAASVRAKLETSQYEQVERRQTFEPGDPARAPTSGLVWFSVIAVITLLVGLFFAARVFFSPAAELPSLVEDEVVEEAQEGAEAAPAEEVIASGPVVFTAEGDAWVRFYTDQGVLMEGVLEEGDSFTLPETAQNPLIITARPDLLAVSIGGRSVAKLSEEMQTLTDVPVDAASLLARGEAAEEPTATSPAPASTATSAPRITPSSPAPRPSPTTTPRPAASPSSPPQPAPSPTETVSIPVVQETAAAPEASAPEPAEGQGAVDSSANEDE